MLRSTFRGAAWLLVLTAFTWVGCAPESPVDDSPTSPALVADDGLDLYAAPAGYYDGVDATDASTLRATLHEAIDDHTRFPYTSTATDTWDVLETADEDPNDPGRILDVYRNASYQKWGGGNTDYNREHSWPKSYGFPNDNSSNYPYTDCHHLFLSNDSYNSARSNRPFRDCDAGCSEYPTEVNDGRGGGSGTYPGNSNWGTGSFTQGTWQVWSGRKGDIARAMFYMDLRYEGGTHAVTGVSEPDLILTDDEALIDASNTGGNESVAYMGMLTVLIQWHLEDPVDERERARNDAVFSFQGNRNPFVDHPEWVDCLFLGTCDGGGTGGDTTPPAMPTGLVATAGDGTVDLDWADNGESDLDGYLVYRATSSGGPYAALTASPILDSVYTDTSVSNGTTYHYVVSAVDLSGNESATSAEVAATPQSSGGTGGGAIVWINEFHYDNRRGDENEFVEVAGTAGTDLAGWTIVGYNGNGGGVYDTIALAGTLADQQGGFGTLAVDFLGLQNGAPDGIALVDASGTVVDFVSYEGTLTATDGPAAGTTSTDVGVAEDASTNKNHSLQLTGTGAAAADFVWQGPLASTRGLPNDGQTFGDGSGGGGDPGGGDPGTGDVVAHVASIVPGVATAGPNSRGEATVVVVDAAGQPVADATVTCTFTGSVNETLSGVTGTDGSVVLTTNDKVRGSISFTVCVDAVSGTALTYDPGANVESCDSHPGA